MPKSEQLLKENAELTLSDKADMSNYEKPSSENSKPFSDLFRTSDFAKDDSSDLTNSYDFDYDLDENDNTGDEITGGADGYTFDYGEGDLSDLENHYNDSLTSNFSVPDNTTTAQSDAA